MVNSIRLRTLVGGGIVLSCVHMYAQTWSTFQYDARHTGQTSFRGPQSNTVSCQFNFATGNVPGSPVIASDGTIYVTTGNTTANPTLGSLIAFNPDCTSKWTLQLPGSPGQTVPSVAPDGTVYVHANGADNLVGIATITAATPGGLLKWRYELNGGAGSFVASQLSTPTVAPDGTVWVGGMDTGLYALNTNGTLKCVVSPNLSSIQSTPAIAQSGTVYVAAPFKLFAYDANCAAQWSFTLSNNSQSGYSPSIGADGTIYVQNGEGLLYAINANGTQKWVAALDTGLIFYNKGTPAVAPDGTVYLVANALYAFAPDGSRRWKFNPGESGDSSPAIDVDGTIYFRTASRTYAVNPNGTQRWASSASFLNQSPTYSAAIASSGALAIGGPSRLLVFSSVSDPRSTLTVSKTGSGAGTVTAAGIDCGSDCTESYGIGSVVTLTATPAEGSTLISLGSNCADGRVTMTSNNSCSAKFALNFTDSTLSALSTIIKAVHITELRTRINNVRVACGESEFAWATPTLGAGTTTALGAHITELRNALAAAYVACTRTPPVYTDPALVPGSTLIKAVHIAELRNSVIALE